MRTVLLRKNYPPCFAGERAGYPDEIADKLVADGAAFEVDANGKPILAAGEVDPAKPKRGKRGSGKESKQPASNPSVSVDADADDLKFNPFAIDGLDGKLVEALAGAGITTLEELQEYMAGDKPLVDIDGIGEVYAAQLTELYSA